MPTSGPDGHFGYPVDAGVGTLADAVAVRALAHWESDRLDEVYIPAQVPPAPAAVDAITDESTAANVIIVSCGDPASTVSGRPTHMSEPRARSDGLRREVATQPIECAEPYYPLDGSPG